MSRVAGKEILVYVDIDAVPTLVGGQKSAELPRSRETIDVTAKDSEGWKEYLGGNAGWEISFESFLIEDDPAFLEIEESYESGLEKEFVFKTKTGTYTGKAIVTELNIGGEDGDAGTVSFSLQGTGPIEKTG